MVINDEIKFPRPIRVDPFKTSPGIEQIDRVTALEKIGRFRRRWMRSRQGGPGRKDRTDLSPAEIKTLQESIARANQDLEAQGLFIRLVLGRDESGYYIDVYDCTDPALCAIINDIEINVDEIPHLLTNIARETGLLVDKIL